jgi:hypothetical protein
VLVVEPMTLKPIVDASKPVDRAQSPPVCANRGTIVVRRAV